ncbi:MAG: hypothetical protein HY912_17475 [Desulfomonile tiedjei]|uniref:Uncharacterized protein n=1 Tax=Desulfomonile tiedjei TaxID=2358 RepID=A0A9D6V4B6_9BACT|nr:hypothetical protein [Desulfomonile tiedjei]
MEEQDSLEMWISTDELKDTVFSLRIVSGFLEKAESDPFYWKWIIIIFHNALQTFMVAVLHDRCKVGSSKGKRNKKLLQKWKDLHDLTRRRKILSEKLEDVYMADFMEIYENLQSLRVDGVTLDKPFEPTEKQEESIRELVFWRNYFVHLLPATRLLNAWEYLRLMPPCVEFAEFLTQAPRLLVFGDTCKEARESVSALKSQIESLRQKYIEKYPQLGDIE